ncbi:unnamed protein product [Brachionus calyciflorus]|uniref:G-protein coupled receptors family 1 profile domain-containing protein n=1 Tax=Brachionus calyciflorus TaxID=104777 RepID=A0A813MGN3_9BILA|nr:unnamed protein product [Brachionus calyciflorus]
MNIFYILLKVLSIIAIIIVVFGVLSSLLSFYICYRIKNNATFIFLSYLSITSIFTLYKFPLNGIVSSLFNIDFLNINIYECKISMFIQFTSLQICAWILVLVSVEQYLCVKIQHWRTIHFKPKRAYITVTSLVLFFMAFNFNFFFTFGFEVDYPIEVVKNSTEFNMTQNVTIEYVKKILCYGDSRFPWTLWMNDVGRVHLVLYSLGPATILFISNILLISHLYTTRRPNGGNSAQNDKKKNKQDQMTKTIIFMTLLFTLITLTSTIIMWVFTFFTDYGEFLFRLTGVFIFAYHGLNFIVFYISNNRFRSEFKKLFGFKNNISSAQ